jgi:hypothetical protein
MNKLEPGLYWAHWSDTKYDPSWLLVNVIYCGEAYLYMHDTAFDTKQFKDFKKIDLKDPDGKDYDG